MSAPLHFDDGTPIYCEWTPRGPDKSLMWACGQPATVDDAENDAWYCAEHATRCAEPGCTRRGESGPYTGSAEYCRVHWGVADRSEWRAQA